MEEESKISDIPVEGGSKRNVTTLMTDVKELEESQKEAKFVSKDEVLNGENTSGTEEAKISQKPMHSKSVNESSLLGTGIMDNACGKKNLQGQVMDETKVNVENKKTAYFDQTSYVTEKNAPTVNGESTDEAKWNKLEEELKKAQGELRRKDAEMEKLKDMKEQVEGELEDFTASLFQEAHRMVQEAKMKEVISQKSLEEMQMKMDGLEAEVGALKALLITSTPSRPNMKQATSSNVSLSRVSKVGPHHKRTPSHNHLFYGRSEEERQFFPKESDDQLNTNQTVFTPEVVDDKIKGEVDPELFSSFETWREKPDLKPLMLMSTSNGATHLDKQIELCPFLKTLLQEDVNPALNFPNHNLVSEVRRAVNENSIWIEALPEKDRNMLPQECALLNVNLICNYRMKFSFDSEGWYLISKICRDRVATVCELFNYLRYIQSGLVKASLEDSYWEIIRLRKQIALAKLGLLAS